VEVKMEKNKNATFIILGILLIGILFFTGFLTDLFAITGNEILARNAPSQVDAGKNFNVQYTASNVQGDWAVTIVETWNCGSYGTTERKLYLASYEGTTKTVSYLAPSAEGVSCVLTGNYQYGDKSIRAWNPQTITTKVTVLPITLTSFTTSSSQKSLTGAISWSGGQSPYTVVVSNWGDGLSTNYGSITSTSKAISHTYANAGTYTISYCINDNTDNSANYCGTKSVTLTCTPQSSSQCYNNNLYWYDSCGVIGSIKETCQNGCENNACKVCATSSDTNCDGLISRDELGVAITKWINNQISRNDLGSIITAWAGQ
jgi:hypothetical protein